MLFRWPLERTSNVALRYAIAISALVFSSLAARLIFAFTEMHHWSQPIIASLLLLESFFLLRLSVRAMIIARWVWGIVITFFLITGLANPFFWDDYGPSKQPVGSFGWWLPSILVLTCVCGAWCLYVIRKNSPKSLYERRT